MTPESAERASRMAAVLAELARDLAECFARGQVNPAEVAAVVGDIVEAVAGLAAIVAHLPHLSPAERREKREARRKARG